MSDLVSVHIAAWLACLSFVVVLLNQGSRLLETLKGKFREVPAPDPVQFMTRDLCDVVHRNSEQEMRALRSQIESLRLERDAAMVRLKEDVRTLSEQLREDVRSLHARIDDLPSQLITILRNTGALK